MRTFVIGLVVIVSLGGAAGVADADPKQALKLNVQGMQKYAKKKYWEAAELFAKAIAADPTLAYAHYNLASMASLTNDFPVVIRELEWCKKSTDPVAAKLLAKAKTDKDLERALMHPKVRELAGVPALDTMALDAVLLERTGIWGDGPMACGPAAVTITFRKGGKFSAVGVWGCNDDPITKKSDVGTWAVQDGVVTLTTKKPKVFDAAQITGELAPCTDKKDEYGYCLILDDREESGMGTTRILRRGTQSW